MDFKEEMISSKRIFKGNVITVRVDEVLLPNKKKSTREIVEHSGAVCIVPITDDGFVYMVKQYRYAFNSIVLEIPAGKLDNGEKPDQAARRELEEEVGVTCNELIYIGEYHPSVAILTEVIHMYIAKDIKSSKQNLDDDEFLEVVKYPIEKIVNMIISGEIKDGKTIAAILKAYHILKEKREK